jgi:hypothetical protein
MDARGLPRGVEMRLVEVVVTGAVNPTPWHPVPRSANRSIAHASSDENRLERHAAGAARRAGVLGCRLRPYRGRFRMHCHNMVHEDMGMMMNYAIR